MEVNGRFWGSLELAVDAGVDFPFLAFQLARGIRPDAPPEYQPGVKNRWILGDLDHLLLRLFRSADALNLPDGADVDGAHPPRFSQARPAQAAL